MNIQLLISYDGAPFLGWQKTSFGPSVEEALESVLFRLLQEKVTLQAASRTDRGVHAEGQVVNFIARSPVDLFTLKRALNALLPKEIVVQEAVAAKETFHPTLDARAKEYHYHICFGTYQLPFFRHFSWHYPYSLCIETMKHAASLLVGRRDFTSFCNDSCTMPPGKEICTLMDVQIHPLTSHRLRIELLGDRFLYKMARNIVGTLAYIGSQKFSLENLPALFEKRDRKAAAITAPAHGLILKRVLYD